MSRLGSGKWGKVRGGVAGDDWRQADEAGKHAMEGDGQDLKKGGLQKKNINRIKLDTSLKIC